MLNRKLVVGITILMFVATAVGWYLLSGSGTSPDQARLVELDASSFARLRDDFNRAVGKIRIILLLSPT